MDRTVRCCGINGAQVFHAIEIATDRWHWTTPDRSGILIATWESLITSVADLIGEGTIYSLQSHLSPPQNIDRAGNTWLEHEYLCPHQYLPRLIPKWREEAPAA